MSILRSLPLCSFFALAFAAAPDSIAAAERERVLIVVSGEGRDAGKTRPGFEMDEFAQAWLIFRDNGLAIDVASPNGGKVEADKYDAKEAFNASVLADPQAVSKLGATLATRDVRAADYKAVFVVGGKGAMFDLPVDKSLAALVADVYEAGGVVSAVCHGPAALVDVRLDDGTPLVAGKSLTGFSNEEETVFGKRWAKEFRFLLEDAMRERGARWQEAPLMMPKVVVDARIVTGQNPYSTPAAAEAVVRALGRKPVARTPWRDEVTMTLVERLLAGEADAARKALADDRERYHVDLIGLLGYYQLKTAADDAAVRRALAIMQLAEPHMPAPQIGLGIAEAWLKLGERERARERLDRVLESHPDMPEAKELKARMSS